MNWINTNNQQESKGRIKSILIQTWITAFSIGRGIVRKSPRFGRHILCEDAKEKDGCHLMLAQLPHHAACHARILEWKEMTTNSHDYFDGIPAHYASGEYLMEFGYHYDDGEEGDMSPASHFIPDHFCLQD